MVSTSEKRYISLVKENAATAEANTDIISDVAITEDGVLRIGFETLAAEDVRITIDG